MRSIRNIISLREISRKEKNLKGKVALVRVDFNVPIRGNKVLDATRINVAYPTLRLLLKKGMEKIIILSHHSDPKQSLAPVRKILAKNFSPARVHLLENLRMGPGEEKNDLNFAKKLAKLGDIYINEAFPDSHRAHASIVSLPKLLPAYAGLRLEAEVKNLSHVFKNPPRPFLFILGGAKFSTKLPLIKKFTRKADKIFIGGALANNFFKEMGMNIGKSLADRKKYGLKKLARNPKIILPEDVVVSVGRKQKTKTADKVLKNEIISDIGPKATATLFALVRRARFILWNGPLGKYEFGYGGATEKIWKAAIKSRARIVIGGGDTLAALSNKNHKLPTRIFISNGGGAMLEFLAKGTLPGLRALK